MYGINTIMIFTHIEPYQQVQHNYQHWESEWASF